MSFLQYIEQWYTNLPIITKSYMTACLLTTLAVHLDLVPVFLLYLNFELVYNKFQFWRLATSFLYFGGFGLSYIFHMVFLVRHSTLLEESSFRGRSSDFFFFFLFGSISLLFIDFVFWYNSLISSPTFLGPSLAMMVVYVWSRRNPNVRMSFLQIFTFNAPYLPWVIIGIEILLSGDRNSWSVFDLMGIAVGHIYYFLEDVYPVTTGRKNSEDPTIFEDTLGSTRRCCQCCRYSTTTTSTRGTSIRNVFENCT